MAKRFRYSVQMVGRFILFHFVFPKEKQISVDGSVLGILFKLFQLRA